MIRSEEDVCAAYSGDNIKLKLKGVEEEVCQKRSFFALKNSTENDTSFLIYCRIFLRVLCSVACQSHVTWGGCLTPR